MAKMKWYDWTAIVLLVVGGVNWGLAIWDVNLVTMIFGGLANWVYGLVGISAVYSIFSLAKK